MSHFAAMMAVLRSSLASPRHGGASFKHGVRKAQDDLRLLLDAYEKLEAENRSLMWAFETLAKHCARPVEPATHPAPRPKEDSER